MRQFHVVVDDDSVVPHGHAAVLRLLAVGELSGREIDVVGLPRQRREGHVEVRFLDRGDAAALVVVRLQPERIEHLHFIAALQITPAVAAARHERAIRNLKLEVQRAALMLELAGRALLQQSVVGHAAVLKLIGVLAIKQHDCSLRRLGSERGTLANDPFQFADDFPIRRNRHHTVFDRCGLFIRLECGDASDDFSLTRCRFVLVPTITRQPAVPPHRVKLSFAERDDLHAELFLAVGLRDFADVFALDEEAGVIALFPQWFSRVEV